MKAQIISLNDASKWRWKEHTAEPPDGLTKHEHPWQSVFAFPSEIHVELLKAGMIPDPFLGFNEHKVQWISEREWLYMCTFHVEGGQLDSDIHAQVRFEGLDTFCDVSLNGKRILAANNMFRTYTIALEPRRILAESANTLLLHFKSAKSEAKELERQYGKVRAGSCNLGDPSRVYVRKAQYDWRWDWGPELMTCGPYRPISLVIYRSRLAEVYTQAMVSSQLEPSFNLSVDIVGDLASAYAIRCTLRQSSTSLVIRDETRKLRSDSSETQDLTRLSEVLSWPLNDDVELWWPVGYGNQVLYEAEIVLLGQDGEVLDSVVKRVGFRRVRLVQEPINDADRYGNGTTFLFEVNGVRMFMGGSNWIPADNFLTTVTDERYRAWLTLLRDGNQNMVRIWGGGIYEPDEFYDICDELGILVWQDFQFACGVYPANSEFVASVKAEAEDNVKRLRHHPSLAIFCGNNEDYQQVMQWGDVEDLPARVLYETILPEVVSSLTNSEVAYHFGSPYGGKGWDTTDPTVGDIHQWDVWAGKERPWQNYGAMGGRFVSEFGIPAMPDIRTVDYWLDGNIKDRWPQSKTMAQHCRAGAFERRFAVVMNANFRFTEDLETYIYHQQIMQSEAISLAYRMWRREWKGRGKEYCAGVLVWQLNDCWPVTSWSLADYFLRPKAVYYTVARELKPITAGIFRTVHKNRENDRPAQFYEFGAFQSTSATIEIWGTNSTLKPRSTRLEIRCFDLKSNWTYSKRLDVVLGPNQSTPIATMDCPCPPAEDNTDITTSYSVVVAARLFDSTSGELLSRYADWPQPYRHVEFPDPQLEVLVKNLGAAGDSEVILSVTKPVKGLLLSVDGGAGNVKWSDNALDICPGDPQPVFVSGLSGREIRFSYMK